MAQLVKAAREITLKKWNVLEVEAAANEVNESKAVVVIGREGMIDDTKPIKVWKDGVVRELDLGKKPLVNNDKVEWEELYGHLIKKGKENGKYKE